MKVVFLIGNVGDYHNARLADIRTSVGVGNSEFNAVVIFKKNRTYFHRNAELDEKIADTSEFTYLFDEKSGQPGPLKTMWRVIRQLITARPDLILTIGYNFDYSVAGLIYSKCLRRSKIVFCADSKFDDGVRTPWRECMKSLLAKRYDGAIVAGMKHRDYFAFLGIPIANLRIGYDVVDNEFFTVRASYARANPEAMRKLYALPERYILCVSRLIERKQVGNLLAAYRRSLAISCGIKLIIVGDGPEREYLKRLALEMEISGHVTFINRIKNDEMPFFYGMAKCCVLVSRYDQWGLCLNEALASGIPVICTRKCGAADELVRHGENGYVVDDTVEDIVIYLDKIITSEFESSPDRLSNRIERWNLSLFSDNVIFFLKKFFPT